MVSRFQPTYPHPKLATRLLRTWAQTKQPMKLDCTPDEDRSCHDSDDPSMASGARSGSNQPFGGTRCD